MPFFLSLSPLAELTADVPVPICDPFGLCVIRFIDYYFHLIKLDFMSRCNGVDGVSVTTLCVNFDSKFVD